MLGGLRERRGRCGAGVGMDPGRFACLGRACFIAARSRLTHISLALRSGHTLVFLDYPTAVAMGVYVVHGSGMFR